MEYVLMNESHVTQIAELEKLCFSMPWSEKAFRSELSNPLSLWLVAEDHGVVAGYVGSQTVLGETDMMNVAVHPDYRRSGIGRQLVNELVLRLKEQGSHILVLEVRVSNEAAISLYEQLGFECIGRRPNYYSNPKEDAYILRKEWSV